MDDLPTFNVGAIPNFSFCCHIAYNITGTSSLFARVGRGLALGVVCLRLGVVEF